MNTPQHIGSLAIGGVPGLGATVRALRQRRGLSQHALAAAGRLHEDGVGTIERGAGKNPSLVRVTRLAGGLGVSVSVLTAGFVWPPASVVPLAHAEMDGTLDAPRSAPARLMSLDLARAVAMGTVLTALREGRRRSLGEVARDAGTGRRYLAALEQGRVGNPGVATLIRIARALRDDDQEAHAPLDARLALIACVFAAELSTGAAIRLAMRSHKRLGREQLDLHPEVQRA
jgi:transcriptional regulator with XRE-family HTH domain